MDAKKGEGTKNHRVVAFYYFRIKRNPNRKEIKVWALSCNPCTREM